MLLYNKETKELIKGAGNIERNSSFEDDYNKKLNVLHASDLVRHKMNATIKEINITELDKGEVAWFKMDIDNREDVYSKVVLFEDLSEKEKSSIYQIYRLTIN